jgi:hypothetical protein
VRLVICESWSGGIPVAGGKLVAVSESNTTQFTKTAAGTLDVERRTLSVERFGPPQAAVAAGVEFLLK